MFTPGTNLRSGGSVRAVNLTICFICAAVMLVIIAGTYFIDTGDNRTSAATVNIMKSNFLFNVLCFFSIWLEESAPPVWGVIVILMWFCFFSTLFYFVEYVYTYTDPDLDPRKNMLVPFIAGAAGFLSMNISGFIVRDPVIKRFLLNFAVLCGLSFPLTAGYTVYRNRRRLNKDNIIAFTVYTAVGFASLLLQAGSGEVHVMNVGLTLSALFIYVVLSMRRYLLVSEQRRELSETRMKMLQMQMNPHFLSNTMNTIYHLCKKDPDKAMQGIDDLSGFLRNNLDLSSGQELIPFSREMESIRYYYSLEQMRRAGKLKISYMVETEDFLVPPFSVQVFAENAVKHGFKGDQGGTISFTVRKQKDGIEISIIDNGTGFDGNKQNHNDTSGHYGITNAEERLKTLLNGEVSIISHQETGTIVMIKIPDRKEGTQYENTDSGR